MRTKTILLLVFLLLIAGPLYAAGEKVLRSYEWNGHRYCVVQTTDGSRIEIKGAPDIKDADAVAKCVAMTAQLAETAAKEAEAVVTAKEKALTDYSDADIIKEVQRRKLTAKDLGLETPK